MSLNLHGRSIAFLIVLALIVAVVSASCGGTETRSTVAPSSLSAAASPGSDGSARVTTSDDEPDSEPKPAPNPEPDPTPGPDPAPDSDPAPAPNPAPPAPSPDTNPGAFPAPPSRRPVRWTPTPDTHEFLTVRVEPNPVPHSGVPVPVASCQALAHTWYYKHIIQSRTGNFFVVKEQENFFDGYLVSRRSINIEIPGQQNVSIESRWCSGYGIAHTAQQRFRVVMDKTGTVVILNGPVMQLQANPNYVPPPAPAPASQLQRSRANFLLVWGD